MSANALLFLDREGESAGFLALSHPAPAMTDLKGKVEGRFMRGPHDSALELYGDAARKMASHTIGSGKEQAEQLRVLHEAECERLRHGLADQSSQPLFAREHYLAVRTQIMAAHTGQEAYSEVNKLYIIFSTT